MVVSRRNPVPAVASRTNSAQAIPRKQKHATSPLTGEPDASNPPRQPQQQQQPQQRVASTRNSKRRRAAKKPPRTLGWTDRFFLFSLFSFIAYAAVVCTPFAGRSLVPYEDQPLTCRALITYRTAVLEPYVVPGVKVAYQHTLGHPAVQTHIQPHLAQLKSHSKPVLEAVELVHEQAVKPAIEVVYGQVWKGYVVPWYYSAFLPRYNIYIAPRLEAGWEHGVKQPLQPYVDLAKVHARDIQVYIHTKGIHHVKEAAQPAYERLVDVYTQVQPTVAKVCEHAQPVIASAYAMTKQALETAWVHGRPYACQAYKTLKFYLGIALKEGGKARRTYVDPHVHKILERVRVSGVDVGSATVRASATSGTLEDAQIVFEEEVVAPTSTTVPEPTAEEETVVADIPVTPVEEEVVPTPPSATPIEDAQEETVEAPAPATPTPVAEDPAELPVADEETLLSAVSVAEQSADAAPTDDLDEAIAEPSGAAQDIEEDAFVQGIEELKKMEEERIAQMIKDTGDEIAATLTTATPEPEEEPTPVVVYVTSTMTVEPTEATQAAAGAGGDDDFDDFLNDLGIEAIPEDTPTEHAKEAAQALEDAVNAEPAVELTEEEQREKRKQETAVKRAAILRRHQEWQKKLAELVEEQKANVVRDVDDVRIWAASELGDEYLDKASRAKETKGRYRKVERAEGEQGLGKRAIGGLERQGERLLKGLETYVGKAKTRSAQWKGEGEVEVRKAKAKGEKEKWEEVVGKVEDRFGAVVKGVQSEVHEWYKGMRAREHDLAMEAAAAVKNLAEDAQSDLAMDYAWLDDVTYRDWQTYHDLMRTYEQFEVEAAQVVHNSSNPTTTEPDATKLAKWPAFTTPDPLVHALDALQRELDDVVVGFGYAVSSIKGEAASVLSIYNLDEPSPEGGEGDGFFSVKHGKGELVDDMRGMPGYEGGKAVPVQGREKEDVGRILVGKDPVVVERALGEL